MGPSFADRDSVLSSPNRLSTEGNMSSLLGAVGTSFDLNPDISIGLDFFLLRDLCERFTCIPKSKWK